MGGLNFLTAFLPIAILSLVANRYGKRWGEQFGEWSTDRYGDRCVDAIGGWMERHPDSRITVWTVNYLTKRYGRRNETDV